MLCSRSFLDAVVPQGTGVYDFYQEWSSARNVREGLGVYTPIRETLPRYLGIRVPPDAEIVWTVNAHPPTSVLLAVPFSYLEYRSAFLAWNVCSLACLGGSLWICLGTLWDRVRLSALLPLLCALLICEPLREQLIQGQLNLWLLLLITLTWSSARSGNSIAAGAWLGLATAIKLFPGFLMLYFVVRRDWRAVLSGGLALGLASAATALICGPESYADYVRHVMPTMPPWTGSFTNWSLPGLWCKLFAPTGHYGPTEPLWDAAWLRPLATAISTILICGLLAGSAWRDRGPRDFDRSFGLAVVGMLLVSPVTWSHYFLLLLIPLAVAFCATTGRPVRRVCLMVSAAVLMIATPRLLMFLSPQAFSIEAVRPWDVLITLGIPCYALMVLFVVLWQSRHSENA